MNHLAAETQLAVSVADERVRGMFDKGEGVFGVTCWI